MWQTQTQSLMTPRPSAFQMEKQDTTRRCAVQRAKQLACGAETEAKILAFIQQHPGCNYTAIVGMTNMTKGYINRRLRSLEDKGLVVSKKEGQYKIYRVVTG